MLKKNIASLSLCAVVLLASAPSQAFAQTLAQAAPPGGGQGAGDAPAKSRPDLQAALAEVAAKPRAGTLPAPDMKRLERERQDPQSTAKPQAEHSKRDKVIIYSIVAGLVVLAVVLALTTKKGGHTFCDVDPGDPDCIGPR